MGITIAALAAFGLGNRPVVAESYTVDAVHSSVVYRVKHLGVSYAYGRFNKIEGTFAVDAADPTKSKLEFTIKTDSIDTGNQGRDGHLKGPDFFNARQFPNITFKSKSVAAAGKDTYEVTGDLTLHGVTKEVTLKIENTGSGPGARGGKVAGLHSEFTIKRSDFGMSNMVGPVADEVTVLVSVEGAAS
jgi:polyisoprenoid-binding protein YceI